MLDIPKPATLCHIPDDQNRQLDLCENLEIYLSPSLLAETNTCNIRCILVSSRLAVMWHCVWLHFVFSWCTNSWTHQRITEAICFQGWRRLVW